MKVADQVVVVTGGAGGIGRAMVRKFAAEKAKAVVVADRDFGAAEALAKEVNGFAIACDVSKESELQKLVAETTRRYGQIDLFCSNAGIGLGAGLEAPDSQWQRIWDVNLMSHVWAMRALLPQWQQRQAGYFVITSSAAGLLAMVGDAAYTVTKAGAVALAEWISITYGNQGIKVSACCPLFVRTPLLDGALAVAGGKSIVASGRTLEPEDVANAVVAGLEAEKFLILPHEEVFGFVQKKAADRDRWLASMRKLAAMK